MEIPHQAWNLSTITWQHKKHKSYRDIFFRIPILISKSEYCRTHTHTEANLLASPQKPYPDIAPSCKIQNLNSPQCDIKDQNKNFDSSQRNFDRGIEFFFKTDCAIRLQHRYWTYLSFLSILIPYRLSWWEKMYSSLFWIYLSVSLFFVVLEYYQWPIMWLYKKKSKK